MTACPTCAAFYGDSAPCDESKPQCSPHRRADGSPGPWPTLTIVVVGSFTPEYQGPWHTDAAQRAEVKAMKAAARASKHAVWPPVPKGYAPPAAHRSRAHIADPTVANHPLGWVNDSLTPAWRRFTAQRAESPSERARFDRAERESHADYARRLGNGE